MHVLGNQCLVEFNWLYHLLYVGKASAIHAPSFV